MSRLKLVPALANALLTIIGGDVGRPQASRTS